jgi:tetratricopeptide (TPR) repeat protein
MRAANLVAGLAFAAALGAIAWYSVGATPLHRNAAVVPADANRAATPRGADRAGQLLQQGRLLLARQDFQGAALLFEAAIAQDASFAEPQLELARSLAALGDRRRALAAVTAALRLQPYLGEALLFRGQLLIQAGSRERGEHDFEKAARLPGMQGIAEFAWAQALAAQSQCAAALPHFDAAIARDARDPGKYIARADCLDALGESARSAADRATASQLTRGVAPAKP